MALQLARACSYVATALKALVDEACALQQVTSVSPCQYPATLAYAFCSVSVQVIFRNVHKLLVDTASSEFLFCLDFWEDEAVFKELFGPVVAVVESDLATQLQVGVFRKRWHAFICSTFKFTAPTKQTRRRLWW